MWGATPFDQLYCRIQFKSARYEGEFTPPRTTLSLDYPSSYGGMNWGSVSVDESRGYMIVNDIRLPQYVRLIPRSEVKNPGPDGKTETGFAPQAGTPYALSLTDFLSPLGIPCQQPPYGTFSAIDLVTRKIVWQVPAGTVEDMGPLGIKTGLQIPIGMPTLGGPITTASGLTFFAGTMVYYLRALDTETGQEVWKARMPAGSQATPMSYLSPATGRQYVVISVGGTRGSADRGDYLIAYALPK